MALAIRMGAPASALLENETTVRPMRILVLAAKGGGTSALQGGGCQSQTALVYSFRQQAKFSSLHVPWESEDGHSTGVSSLRKVLPRALSTSSFWETRVGRGPVPGARTRPARLGGRFRTTSALKACKSERTRDLRRPEPLAKCCLPPDRACLPPRRRWHQ